MSDLREYYVNLYNTDDGINGRPAGALWMCNECAILYEEMIEFAGFGDSTPGQCCELCDKPQMVLEQLRFRLVDENPS